MSTQIANGLATTTSNSNLSYHPGFSQQAQQQQQQDAVVTPPPLSSNSDNSSTTSNAPPQLLQQQPVFPPPPPSSSVGQTNDNNFSTPTETTTTTTTSNDFAQQHQLQAAGYQQPQQYSIVPSPGPYWPSPPPPPSSQQQQQQSFETGYQHPGAMEWQSGAPTTHQLMPLAPGPPYGPPGGGDTAQLMQQQPGGGPSFHPMFGMPPTNEGSFPGYMGPPGGSEGMMPGGAPPPHGNGYPMMPPHALGDAYPPPHHQFPPHPGMHPGHGFYGGEPGMMLPPPGMMDAHGAPHMGYHPGIPPMNGSAGGHPHHMGPLGGDPGADPHHPLNMSGGGTPVTPTDGKDSGGGSGGKRGKKKNAASTPASTNGGATNTGGDSSANKGMNKFTEGQKSKMEDLYRRIPYPSSVEKTQLSEYVGLSYDQVQRWFEGRRKKQRVMDQKEGKEPLFHPSTKNRRSNDTQQPGGKPIPGAPPQSMSHSPGLPGSHGRNNGGPMMPLDHTGPMGMGGVPPHAMGSPHLHHPQHVHPQAMQQQHPQQLQHGGPGIPFSPGSGYYPQHHPLAAQPPFGGPLPSHYPPATSQQHNLAAGGQPVISTNSNNYDNNNLVKIPSPPINDDDTPPADVQQQQQNFQLAASQQQHMLVDPFGMMPPRCINSTGDGNAVYPDEQQQQQQQHFQLHGAPHFLHQPLPHHPLPQGYHHLPNTASEIPTSIPPGTAFNNQLPQQQQQLSNTRQPGAAPSPSSFPSPAHQQPHQQYNGSAISNNGASSRNPGSPFTPLPVTEALGHQPHSSSSMQINSSVSYSQQLNSNHSMMMEAASSNIQRQVNLPPFDNMQLDFQQQQQQQQHNHQQQQPCLPDANATTQKSANHGYNDQALRSNLSSMSESLQQPQQQSQLSNVTAAAAENNNGSPPGLPAQDLSLNLHQPPQHHPPTADDNVSGGMSQHLTLGPEQQQVPQIGNCSSQLQLQGPEPPEIGASDPAQQPNGIPPTGALDLLRSPSAGFDIHPGAPKQQQQHLLMVASSPVQLQNQSHQQDMQVYAQDISAASVGEQSVITGSISGSEGQSEHPPPVLASTGIETGGPEIGGTAAAVPPQVPQMATQGSDQPPPTTPGKLAAGPDGMAEQADGTTPGSKLTKTGKVRAPYGSKKAAARAAAAAAAAARGETLKGPNGEVIDPAAVIAAATAPPKPRAKRQYSKKKGGDQSPGTGRGRKRARNASAGGGGGGDSSTMAGGDTVNSCNSSLNNSMDMTHQLSSPPLGSDFQHQLGPAHALNASMALPPGGVPPLEFGDNKDWLNRDGTLAGIMSAPTSGFPQHNNKHNMNNSGPEFIGVATISDVKPDGLFGDTVAGTNLAPTATNNGWPPAAFNHQNILPPGNPTGSSNNLESATPYIMGPDLMQQQAAPTTHLPVPTTSMQSEDSKPTQGHLLPPPSSSSNLLEQPRKQPKIKNNAPFDGMEPTHKSPRSQNKTGKANNKAGGTPNKTGRGRGKRGGGTQRGGGASRPPNFGQVNPPAADPTAALQQHPAFLGHHLNPMSSHCVDGNIPQHLQQQLLSSSYPLPQLSEQTGPSEQLQQVLPTDGYHQQFSGPPLGIGAPPAHNIGAAMNLQSHHQEHLPVDGIEQHGNHHQIAPSTTTTSPSAAFNHPAFLSCATTSATTWYPLPPNREQQQLGTTPMTTDTADASLENKDGPSGTVDSGTHHANGDPAPHASAIPSTLSSFVTNTLTLSDELNLSSNHNTDTSMSSEQCRRLLSPPDPLAEHTGNDYGGTSGNNRNLEALETMVAKDPERFDDDKQEQNPISSQETSDSSMSCSIENKA